jgi:hypothetical protein
VINTIVDAMESARDFSRTSNNIGSSGSGGCNSDIITTAGAAASENSICCPRNVRQEVATHPNIKYFILLDLDGTITNERVRPPAQFLTSSTESMLRSLRARGHRLCIVSNNIRASQILAELGIVELFDYVVGAPSQTNKAAEILHCWNHYHRLYRRKEIGSKIRLSRMVFVDNDADNLIEARKTYAEGIACFISLEQLYLGITLSDTSENIVAKSSTSVVVAPQRTRKQIVASMPQQGLACVSFLLHPVVYRPANKPHAFCYHFNRYCPKLRRLKDNAISSAKITELCSPLFKVCSECLSHNS